MEAPGIRPGDVGHRVDGVAGADHAEVGHQRGERVVGDLRPGRRHGGDQRGLARRGEAHESDVGDALQLDDRVEAPRPPRRAARSRAPCGGSWPARRCRARPCRPGRAPRGCRRRRGRRYCRPSRRADDGAGGTRRTRSSPRAPLRLLPSPGLPLPAFWCGWWWKSSSVCTFGSTSRTTSPPSPPLPPSGPPSGLNFSRWTEATPWPPLPAATCTATRSTKAAMSCRSTYLIEMPRAHGPVARALVELREPVRVERLQASTAVMETVLRPRRVPKVTAAGRRGRTACRRRRGRRRDPGGSGCRAGGR